MICTSLLLTRYSAFFLKTIEQQQRFRRYLSNTLHRFTEKSGLPIITKKESLLGSSNFFKRSAVPLLSPTCLIITFPLKLKMRLIMQNNFSTQPLICEFSPSSLQAIVTYSSHKISYCEVLFEFHISIRTPVCR